jgi:transcription elongation factor Elf1
VSLTYTFTCPACGERTLVDETVRRLLLDGECLVCGTPISETAFEVVDDPA